MSSETRRPDSPPTESSIPAPPAPAAPSSSRESGQFARAEIVSTRRRWSWAWFAPLLALLVAGALWYQAKVERGVLISITFDDGAGVAPGDPVRYRGVDVGVVRDVGLSAAMNGVRVEVSLREDAEGLAVEGSRFWIVRPEVSLRGVSGLDTLLGPRYITVSPGPADGSRQRTFVGLAGPPLVAAPDIDTLDIVLRADRRGSLTEGAPVYYRDIQVGEVRGARLSLDSTHVEILASIWPRFAPLVRQESRFWNVSGVGVDLGLFRGLSVRTDSLESVLSGGVAFATPERRAGEIVDDGHVFVLEAQPDEDWLGWRPIIEIAADPRDGDR